MNKLLLFTALICAGFAQEDCCSSIKSTQLWLRHTEPKGVGYHHGYTTLEAFAMTPNEVGGFYPYLDLRGHLFNDGKAAGNVGVGGRVLRDERIWGGNLYYDVRGTKKITFNQLSLGLESIGVAWDFFLNGYLNVGRKNSRVLQYEFDYFANHFLFIKRSIDSAMSGLDANVRYHFLESEKWDTYFDIGPYFYRSSFGKNVWGGKAGVSAILANYFFVEATASYDHVFKWIGQGIAGFRLPLGKKTAVNSCSDKTQLLASRLMQIPDHNEIIVVQKKHKVSKAIDPATGQPYFFLFVNNLSHSDGTFESPFPMLAEAQAASAPGDIIYVFEGDGTTTNMDMGITLQDNQQLLGSGVAQQLPTQFGNLTIPQMTPKSPLITNGASQAITLANNNTVSGINIHAASGYGISGTGISGATLKNNVITDIYNGSAGNPSGIYLTGPGLSGTFNIESNTITGFDSTNSNNMHGIYINLTTQFDDIYTSVTSNYVNTFKDGMEIQSAGIVTANISSNTFIARGYPPPPASPQDVGLYLAGTATTSNFTFTLNNNICTGNAVGFNTLPHDGVMIGTASNNQFINSQTGYRMDAGGNGISIITVSNNLFAGNTPASPTDGDFVGQSGDSATVCCKLFGNDALDYGYRINVVTSTCTLNLTSFVGNVGSLSNVGPFPYTTNPTCP